MNKEERLEELLNELRSFAFANTDTKNEKVPESEDLSKGSLDLLYDIDIFISRKPGMRRSVQLLSSSCGSPELFAISLLTSVGSLLDTAVARGIVTEEQIDMLFKMRQQRWQ